MLRGLFKFIFDRKTYFGDFCFSFFWGFLVYIIGTLILAILTDTNPYDRYILGHMFFLWVLGAPFALALVSLISFIALASQRRKKLNKDDNQTTAEKMETLSQDASEDSDL